MRSSDFDTSVVNGVQVMRLILGHRARPSPGVLKLRCLKGAPANVRAPLLPAAGFEIFQVGENITRDSSGGLEGHAAPHHVLVQTGHRQVRGVGSADAGGAVCP